MEVTHNLNLNRFEIVLVDGTAVLDYTTCGKTMTITHTFVPPELRAQNIAGRLAKAAFDFARNKGLKVVPQCSYISVYARRHPEAMELISK